MKNFYLLITCFIMFISVACAQQENPPFIELSDDSDIYLEKIVDGIEIPWGMVFIDTKEFLVTNRDGSLYHVLNGTKTVVDGLPEIDYNGQGGLLDLAIDNNFKNNRFLYFTASVNTEGGKGSNTGLYRAKYDNFQLTDLTYCIKLLLTLPKEDIMVEKFLLMKITFTFQLVIEEIEMLIHKILLEMEEKFIG